MFPSHQTYVFALPGENKTSKILHFLFNAVSLFDSNNAHFKHFVQIFSTLADSIFNCLVVQLLTVNI